VFRSPLQRNIGAAGTKQTQVKNHVEQIANVEYNHPFVEGVMSHAGPIP
jgi:hypothetical protein